MIWFGAALLFIGYVCVSWRESSRVQLFGLACWVALVLLMIATEK